MKNEYFRKSVTFATFCRTVAALVPETNLEAVGRYLADMAIPPYNLASARYWANRIETMLIRERMI